MRIGIDISRLGVAARTGTEHYSYELLAALARIDRQNGYTLYCNGLPAALPPLGPNMQLRPIPAPRLWTHTRLAFEMTRHPPDVLFVPAHVLPIRHPHRSVVTIHDLGYEQFPEAHTAAQRRYLRLSTRWSARAATALIVPSAATGDDLVRLYAVPRAKIHVVPHGLSPRFRPEPDPQRIAAAQARYGISGPYFFSLGTVQPRKNLARLLEAFAQIGGSPQLVIAGKRGWLSEPIERRARELGLEDRVRFAGYVADEDAPALLTGALAFLFPSLYEGFGMPLLEAMACGAPVLASGTSSLPEVADGAALLVNPTDTSAIAAAIARLASDGDLRAMLRKRGLARAAAFSWDHCARQTLDVLRG